MANVDPFVIRWPKKWTEDPELRDTIRYLNRFLHDLWLRTGGSVDKVELASDPDILNTLANLNMLQQQIGSGDFLTGDSTGFTGDSTNIFGDTEQV